MINPTVLSFETRQKKENNEQIIKIISEADTVPLLEIKTPYKRIAPPVP